MTALRQSIRLAFVAALQHLPPRQRAALLLSEVLGWSASEIACCLDMTVAAVNSALQRARATLASRNVSPSGDALTESDQTLLDRYLDAFHRYDVDALVSLLREDATFSMPPFALWLTGRDAVRAWLNGRGGRCRGSRLVPTSACGTPAFAQYRPAADGGPHRAWALVVLECRAGGIASWNSFLDTEQLFPHFGLPLQLDPSLEMVGERTHR
jgi:RNA polymerase sigma-70 factor (ECF subfamily)